MQELTSSAWVQCNGLCPQSPILILVLKEVWPDDAISSYRTTHSDFLLARKEMFIFMG